MSRRLQLARGERRIDRLQVQRRVHGPRRGRVLGMPRGHVQGRGRQRRVLSLPVVECLITGGKRPRDRLSVQRRVRGYQRGRVHGMPRGQVQSRERGGGLIPTLHV